MARACERRFPRPLTVEPAQLPKEPFARDILCLSVVSMLKGVAQAPARGQPDPAWRDRIAAALAPVAARVDDWSAKQDRNGADDLPALSDRLLAASLDLGEPLAVARACGLKGG